MAHTFSAETKLALFVPLLVAENPSSPFHYQRRKALTIKITTANWSKESSLGFLAFQRFFYLCCQIHEQFVKDADDYEKTKSQICACKKHSEGVSSSCLFFLSHYDFLPGFIFDRNGRVLFIYLSSLLSLSLWTKTVGFILPFQGRKRKASSLNGAASFQSKLVY